MLNAMPRNRQLYVFLEEEVVPLKPPVETARNGSDQPVRTDTDIRTESVELVTTETDIRIESVEPVTTDTDVGTELEDDYEDSDYVVVDSTNSDSGFEESENDKTDEEGFAHDVNVGINHEIDINNLKNDLLGGLPAMTLDDENVGFDDLHSASDSDLDSKFTKIRKLRCLEFNSESDSLNPQFEKGMIFGDKDTLKQCLRAKNLALEMVLGSHNEHYSMIYDYLGEIRKTNPGRKTILMLGDRVFLRMYICLKACKDGYKAGCRPVLSIDGCHLKGYYGGTFLAAVGVDANDSIYPIAYVVVEAGNQSSWSWFLSLLGTNLEIGSMDNITIPSDKQKHRTCFRHLYSNFKNKEHFKGKKNHKDALWKAAKATYVKEFEDAMAELKALCWPTHAGDHKYQVSVGPLNQHEVDLEHHTCSCRKWDIIGIPCIHVVSVMILRNERHESYVHACYKTTTQHQIYNHFIKPVRGPNQWLHDTTCESVIEPKLRRPPGRPKKQRVKEADEKKISLLLVKDYMTTDDMTTTSSSPAVCATTSSSPFVFVPTPGHIMTVRWMSSSQEENNGNQQLSQSSTIVQISQEDNSLCTKAKKPRMV
ncbi:hypothetical protein V6N13_058912 [Hibiscus sabdariffa]